MKHSLSSLLLGLAVVLFTAPVGAKDYSYSVSDAFPPNTLLIRALINDSRFTVGTYDVTINNLSTSHAFIFSNGVLQYPIDYPGATETDLRSLNNAGNAVGITRILNANGIPIAHGLLMNGDGLQLLDYPGAVETYLDAINDRGVIAGHYLDEFGVTRYFTFKRGSFRVIQRQLGGFTTINSINNKEIISGATNNANNTYYLKTRNNQLKIYQNPTGVTSAIINEKNVLAGNLQGIGYFRKNNAIRNIIPPDTAAARVTDINNKNEISLWARARQGETAYQYDANTRQYSQVSPPFAAQSAATSINNGGVIAGILADGQNQNQRVFIAYPQ